MKKNNKGIKSSQLTIKTSNDSHNKENLFETITIKNIKKQNQIDIAAKEFTIQALDNQR